MTTFLIIMLTSFMINLVVSFMHCIVVSDKIFFKDLVGIVIISIFPTLPFWIIFNEIRYYIKYCKYSVEEK